MIWRKYVPVYVFLTEFITWSIWCVLYQLMYTVVCTVVTYLVYNAAILTVSGWRSWKRLGLSIMRLADRVPAGPNWQKAFSKLLTRKLLGLTDRDLNLKAPCTRIIMWPPLPFTHWASVKAAWCCQHRRVALCILSDYTNSSRSGRYWELSHLESTIPSRLKHHR